MAQSWEGKSRGNKLGYRIFIAILRMAGTAPAYLLLRIVAFYYFVSAPTYKYIYAFFKKMSFSNGQARWGVYKNYYALGQTLIDKIVTMSGMKSPFTFEFEGEHYIEQIMAGGRGGILISAHVGNYELAGYYFKRLPTKVNIVMVDQEHAQIKQYLESVMEDRSQMSIITIKEDMSHVYEISAALGRNELIAMHADRYVEGSKTIEGMLFGEKANFPIGPFVLAATFKVPVSYTFCFKETNKHYHLYATPPVEYTGNKKESIPQALADYIRELEAKMRQYPTQWFNYYDFWKQ